LCRGDDDDAAVDPLQQRVGFDQLHDFVKLLAFGWRKGRFQRAALGILEYRYKVKLARLARFGDYSRPVQ